MNHHDSELAHLKERLLTMAGLAEASTAMAARALSERSDADANRVRTGDTELDKLEKEVDELCIRLLTTAPLATDLRWIVVAMRISRDLERVGDEATTVARRVLELNQMPELRQVADVGELARNTQNLLREAIDAVARLDKEAARAVIPRDKSIDASNRRIRNELTEFMESNPTAVRRCLALMTISKALERIGDHAKNIAEEVVFVCDGIDIRHTLPPLNS